MGFWRDPWGLKPKETYEWRNRYDDPLKQYRTLYCAERPLTALLEVLAPLRPSRKFQLDLKNFLEGSAAPAPRFANEKLSRAWRQEHVLVSGVLDLQGGRLVDLTDLETLMKLEREIPQLLLDHGVQGGLDHGVLRGPELDLPQAISRFLFEQNEAGLVYGSKIADRKKCAALFEGRCQVVPDLRVWRLAENFPLLVRACTMFEIRLD